MSLVRNIKFEVLNVGVDSNIIAYIVMSQKIQPTLTSTEIFKKHMKSS